MLKSGDFVILTRDDFKTLSRFAHALAKTHKDFNKALAQSEAKSLWESLLFAFDPAREEQEVFNRLDSVEWEIERLQNPGCVY